MKKSLSPDLIGKKFGILTVVSRADNYRKKSQWNCICGCGNNYLALGTTLITGRKKSCGCLGRIVKGNTHRTHGMSNTAEHHAWVSIKTRCYNPNTKSYNHYGGRGIKVCDRWMESFENFFEDMGKKPSNEHSIERIEVNGNYEPNNCKWADKSEQAINRRNKVSNTGHRGVYKNKLRWTAYIKVYKVSIYLGIYEFIEDAIKARKEAEEKYRA